MDAVVKKCQSMLGVLRKASHCLPKRLLRLAYICLVRSHLEYCSATFCNASRTQLKKLDTIQKIGSRVICGAPRDAHSEPLLQSLQLESLESRRCKHVIQIVDAILEKKCHPALLDMFTKMTDGTVVNAQTARLNIGKKRFSIAAKEIYNKAHR